MQIREERSQRNQRVMRPEADRGMHQKAMLLRMGEREEQRGQRALSRRVHCREQKSQRTLHSAIDRGMHQKATLLRVEEEEEAVLLYRGPRMMVLLEHLPLKKTWMNHTSTEPVQTQVRRHPLQGHSEPVKQLQRDPQSVMQLRRDPQ